MLCCRATSPRQTFRHGNNETAPGARGGTRPTPGGAQAAQVAATPAGSPALPLLAARFPRVCPLPPRRESPRFLGSPSPAQVAPGQPRGAPAASRGARDPPPTSRGRPLRIAPRPHARGAAREPGRELGTGLRAGQGRAVPCRGPRVPPPPIPLPVPPQPLPRAAPP